MDTIQDQLTLLEDNKLKIKQAIIDKGQVITDEDPLSLYSAKILDIKTGYDTSDATATSNDIVEGKIAYIKTGKTKGLIVNQESYTDSTICSVYATDTTLSFRNSQNVPVCLQPNAGFTAENSTIVNAIRLSSDVIKEGVTVLGLQGTLKIGVDTTDATATTNDIALNKIAYVKGEKLVGTIPTYDNTSILIPDTITRSKSAINMSAPITTKQILDTTSIITTQIQDSEIVSAINLKSDQIVYGYSVLGVVGSTEAIPSGTSQYKTGSSGPSYSISSTDISITPSLTKLKATTLSNALIYKGVPITSSISNTDLRSAIGLTPELLKKDETILGITGTYIGETGTGTEDATATAEDIIKGKTAYVNKLKIEGLMDVINSSTLSYESSLTTQYNSTYKKFTIISPSINDKYRNGIALRSSSKISFTINESAIANAIGLTSDMIAEGITVLGITGTHTGTGMLTEQEYNECEELADTILAI